MGTPITTTGQLGPLLRRLRKELGLSQAALGEKLGLSQERISRIESAPEKVVFDQLLSVMMVLDAEFQVAMRKPSDKDCQGAPNPAAEEW